MKSLVIIGAGGMGRTLYSNALECKGYKKEFYIKGYLDDNLHSLDGFINYPPVIGTIQEYNPKENDVFACSISGKDGKRCIEEIISRGGSFINLIHKDSKILNNVKIGTGNFIGAFTIVGNEVSVGSHNIIQSFSVIGHDAQIGDFNRIDTHVTCVGGIIIKNQVMVHTGAVINHKVILDNECKVGANSFVIRKVKSGETVLGVPAKRIN